MEQLFCYGCHTLKDPTDFFICRSRKNGRQTRCKACQTRTREKHHLTHPEQEKATSAAYYLVHKDVLLPKHLQWKAEHRIELRIQGQVYYQNNKKKILLRSRQTYDTVTHSIKMSRWRKQNPEKNAALQRIRRARKSGATFIEKVLLKTIFSRDQGICSL